MLELATPQPARHPRPTVKATGLAHLIFERPDLDKVNTFLDDFGFVVFDRTDDGLYARGTSQAPYCYRVTRAKKARFVGFGLQVGARADLETLAALPGASAIALSPHPGGGEVVTLTDPSGNLVEVLFGQTLADELAKRAPLSWNIGGAQPRVNAGHRPPHAPPQVIRIGHLALEAVNFQETCGWYTQYFGFIPSDVQVLPDGSPAVTFMRLDRGEVPSDHHTLALAQGFLVGYNHSAYEVVDADAVGIGQRVLRARGYKHAWGIGRHILGSQIFDYWQDPWGDKHEHYCDGDVYDATAATGLSAVSLEGMSQWGQTMPAKFLKPKLTPGNVLKLIRNVRRSPDLSFKKLRMFLKVMG